MLPQHLVSQELLEHDIGAKPDTPVGHLIARQLGNAADVDQHRHMNVTCPTLTSPGQDVRCASHDSAAPAMGLELGECIAERRDCQVFIAEEHFSPKRSYFFKGA